MTTWSRWHTSLVLLILLGSSFLFGSTWYRIFLSALAFVAFGIVIIIYILIPTQEILSGLKKEKKAPHFNPPINKFAEVIQLYKSLPKLPFQKICLFVFEMLYVHAYYRTSTAPIPATYTLRRLIGSQKGRQKKRQMSNIYSSYFTPSFFRPEKSLVIQVSNVYVYGRYDYDVPEHMTYGLIEGYVASHLYYEHHYNHRLMRINVTKKQATQITELMKQSNAQDANLYLSLGFRKKSIRDRIRRIQMYYAYYLQDNLLHPAGFHRVEHSTVMKFAALCFSEKEFQTIRSYLIVPNPQYAYESYTQKLKIFKQNKAQRIPTHL